MKVGDRVRVVELEDEDKKFTDLKIGDTGIIVSLGSVCCIHFERNIKHTSRNWNDENQSYDMYDRQLEVIQELESDDLEQYKKIGTVKECRIAVDKQKAKIPNDIKTSVIGLTYGHCPMCDRQINMISSECYCTGCGQKLDWGSEGEE